MEKQRRSKTRKKKLGPKNKVSQNQGRKNKNEKTRSNKTRKENKIEKNSKKNKVSQKKDGQKNVRKRRSGKNVLSYFWITKLVRKWPCEEVDRSLRDTSIEQHIKKKGILVYMYLLCIVYILLNLRISF